MIPVRQIRRHTFGGSMLTEKTLERRHPKMFSAKLTCIRLPVMTEAEI